jgi:hypothetical protein
VVGHLGSGRSWTPVVRLRVNGSGKDSDGIYWAATLGPLRTSGIAPGRIDDLVVPLPPGTAYVTELNSDLFGRVEPRRQSALPVPSEISAIFEGRPLSALMRGVDSLSFQGLHVWTGTIESSSIRVPADCAR